MSATIPAPFHLAKCAIADFLRRYNFKSIDASDPNILLRGVAARGDVDTYTDLVNYFNKTDPNHDSEWSLSAALFDAAEHGHLNVIKFIVSMDSKHEASPEDYTAMIDGAITGGHLSILEYCLGDYELNYLITDTDSTVITTCLIHGRYEILLFYLKQHEDLDDFEYLVEHLAEDIYHQADPSALRLVLARFPQTRAILRKVIQSYLPDGQDWRFLRPQEGLASSEELMPDSELWDQLRQLQALTN